MDNAATLEHIQKRQKQWADGRAIQYNRANGRVLNLGDNLFGPLNPETASEFKAADGDELGTGGSAAKMSSLHSSSALVCNVFDYWRGRELAPLLQACGIQDSLDDLQFEQRFPTGLRGNPPNLDLLLSHHWKSPARASADKSCGSILVALLPFRNQDKLPRPSRHSTRAGWRPTGAQGQQQRTFNLCRARRRTVNEFKNANTLAHAVNDSLGAPFVPRLYNRFSPDEALWWLVGCADWPAYRHAKLFFVSRREELPGHQNGIFCGFNIEKGLSRRVAGLYPKELIEGDDWAWERFIASISAEFPALPPSQFVSVAVSYVPPETVRYGDSPESFFAQKDSFEASQADFTMDAHQHLELLSMDVNQNCAEIAQHFETKICAAANLSSLLADLRTFPQSDWSWVDLYIGTVVSKGPIGRLWNDCLKPWSAWLGTSRPASHGRS